MHLKIVMRVCLTLLTTVTIASCTKEETTEDPPASSEKAITAFALKKNDQSSFPAGDVTLTIGEDSVKVELAAGADLTDLIPEITFNGISIIPASGLHQDFSKPVKYTVTAADSSKRQYTILVTKRKTVFVGTTKNFYALDEGNGHLIWKFSDNGSFASSDPALYNGIVYAGSISGMMYAFNANTGAVIWQHALGNIGIGCAPAVAGNTVYVGDNNDNFYALNASTGQEKWRYTTYGNISSSPVLYKNMVIFGSDDSYLYALDTTTGSRVWRYITQGMIVYSAPKISNGVVFIGGRAGLLHAVDANTGKMKWQYSTNGVSMEMSSPAIYNGVVYIGGWHDFNNFSIDGSLYAVNEYTGQEVWRSLDSLGIDTSPCADNGKLYISAEDGYLHALDAATGVELWSKSILPNGSSAAVYGNTLFIGGSGSWYIYALNKDTGAEKWKFDIRNEWGNTSTPVIGRTAKPARAYSIGGQ